MDKGKILAQIEPIKFFQFLEFFNPFNFCVCEPLTEYVGKVS